MNGYARYLPWLVVVLAAIYLVAAAVPPADRDGQRHLVRFGEVPVQHGGRIQPFDTLARITMLIISNRQTFVDEKGNSQPAIKWLLDAMTSELSDKRPAEKYKVFRIDYDQVLNQLGLEFRPLFWRYSIEEFGSQITKVMSMADRADEKDSKQRDLFDARIIELAQHIKLYVELAQWRKPGVIPPASGEGDWQPFLRAMHEARQSGQDNPTARIFGQVLMAYSDGNTADFNRHLDEYCEKLEAQYPDEVQLARFETFFNHFAPFYHCAVLYFLVFLLACLGWVAFTGPLNRAAFWLAVLTLAVHTWALGARMYIQGRPPVTNLYASAIFIGWGCVILGLILELLYRNGIGNVLAATTGALTLIIAHNLATGDTMEMLQAVLDTNFWLSTHVTVVTTGYASTFVAGFLGIMLILRGVLTRTLDLEAYRTLGRMIYGIVCFAMFCSFTGTVLGGIWADQSWGRFWGWDPKENGALIIVLWNALILHARWSGLVQQRGMAVLAVAGNIVTCWSWFGVNMLGVGLHAYGFITGAVFWLLVFIASQLAIIGLGLLPPRLWLSLAAHNQEPRTKGAKAR